MPSRLEGAIITWHLCSVTSVIARMYDLEMKEESKVLIWCTCPFTRQYDISFPRSG